MASEGERREAAGASSACDYFKTPLITLHAVSRGVISQQQVDRLVMNYIVGEEVIRTYKAKNTNNLVPVHVYSV